MFGMSFAEILIIAVIAILFLGPDKLPDAMVKVARFFKSFKNSVNQAKETIEQEMKIQELKEDALTYKKKLEEGAGNIKKTAQFSNLHENLTQIEDDIKSSLEDKTPKKADKDNEDV